MKLAIKLTVINDLYNSPTAREVIYSLCDAAKKIDFPVSFKFRGRKIIAYPESCRVTLLQTYNDSGEGETIE